MGITLKDAKDAIRASREHLTFPKPAQVLQIDALQEQGNLYEPCMLRGT